LTSLRARKEAATPMKFNGSSGRRPSAEARRYIYAVMASALTEDMRDDGGWVYGGIESEFDRRRLASEARKVVAEFLRKAAR
jgi:hypothetical protein